MNFCVLLLCISTSGIYLNKSADKKEAIFYSLKKEYLKKIKNPSINNQNKISNLETEFKSLLLEDYLEVREEWEIEKKLSYLGPSTKTLPPSILNILDRFREHPEELSNFSNFKEINAQLHSLIIFDLESQLQSKPELFSVAQKTAKKKKVTASRGISLNWVLIILLLPLIYLFFKKKNISKV